jgi:hypothetical protein
MYACSAAPCAYMLNSLNLVQGCRTYLSVSEMGTIGSQYTLLKWSDMMWNKEERNGKRP